MHEHAARIDEQAMRVERTIEVRAPLAITWQALTTPEHLASWFGDAAEFPEGMHAGASGWFGWDGSRRAARIERCEPESVLAFTWSCRDDEVLDERASTLATFTLEPIDAGTRVTVVETGFEHLTDSAAARAELDDHAEGWTSELDELVALLADRWSASVVDRDAGEIRRSVTLAAGIELVWQHLTSPAAIEEWWGHPSVFPDGMHAGALGTFAWRGETFPIAIEAFDAPSRWQLVWGELGEREPGPGATRVTFSLEPASVGGTVGTRLTVVESGWLEVQGDIDGRMRENRSGWDAVLDGLGAYVARAAA